MDSKPGYDLSGESVRRALSCIATLLGDFDLLSQQIGTFNIMSSLVSPVVLDQIFLAGILGSPGTATQGSRYPTPLQ